MDGDILIETFDADRTVDVVDDPPPVDVLVIDSGLNFALAWPITHPTLANTQILPVANGFQFIIEGNTILTMTKNGIVYGQ